MHETAQVVHEPDPCARDHPRLATLPWGSMSQYLIVRRCYCSLKPRRRTRETVRAERTPRHRHHLPGITNFQSARYAEIGRDRLCTRLRTWCTSLQLRERPTPACPAYPGGRVRLGAGRKHLIVRGPLPFSRAHRLTVKAFEQRELHGTVTIRPELQVANQNVTQK